VTQFLNSYHCEACDNYWDDQWSSACNDKCAICDREIEPYRSDDVDGRKNEEPFAGSTVR